MQFAMAVRMLSWWTPDHDFKHSFQTSRSGLPLLGGPHASAVGIADTAGEYFAPVRRFDRVRRRHLQQDTACAFLPPIGNFVGTLTVTDRFAL